MYNINSHINVNLKKKLPGEAGNVPLVHYKRAPKKINHKIKLNKLIHTNEYIPVITNSLI